MLVFGGFWFAFLVFLFYIPFIVLYYFVLFFYLYYYYSSYFLFDLYFYLFFLTFPNNNNDIITYLKSLICSHIQNYNEYMSQRREARKLSSLEDAESAKFFFSFFLFFFLFFFLTIFSNTLHFCPPLLSPPFSPFQRTKDEIVEEKRSFVDQNHSRFF